MTAETIENRDDEMNHRGNRKTEIRRKMVIRTEVEIEIEKKKRTAAVDEVAVAAAAAIGNQESDQVQSLLRGIADTTGRKIGVRYPLKLLRGNGNLSIKAKVRTSMSNPRQGPLVGQLLILTAPQPPSIALHTYHPEESF